MVNQSRTASAGVSHPCQNGRKPTVASGQAWTPATASDLGTRRPEQGAKRTPREAAQGANIKGMPAQTNASSAYLPYT
jgi:hypothetical protein